MKVYSVLLGLGTAGIPIAVLAGRPLVTDDAGTVPRGEAEVEAGVSYTRMDDTKHYDIPLGLTLGIVESLEIGLGFGGQLEEREESVGESHQHSGVGDLTTGFKWNPFQDAGGQISHALSVTAKFPTADENSGLGSGETDVDAMYIASVQWRETCAVHWNAGYTFVGCENSRRSQDIVHTGFAAGYQATSEFEVVGELFCNIPCRQTGQWALSANGGIRWAACDGLIFDAAAGCGIRGATPDFIATMGLTWTFGLAPKDDARN